MVKSKHEYSQSPKAIREAKRRKEDYKAKRFNDPLRIFLERRYPKILSEFAELYKYIDFMNPNKKNLCRTSTFKDWLAENPTPLKTILPMPHFGSSTLEDELISLPTMADLKKPSEYEAMSEASTLTLPETSAETSTLVSDIIDEIFGPEGIPDEDLPTANEDEGIELNDFDELAYDIKPFDFF